MRVLVVIPTSGNRPEMLQEALDSVWAQTRKADVVSIRERYSDGIDIAIADRLNAAIEESGCDAFAILSDDDKLDPTFLEKTVAKMEQAAADIVYTDCQFFGERDGRGRPPGRWKQPDIDINTVPLITSLCSRGAWDRAGKFQQVWFFDWDFWWRCFYSGATAEYLPEQLFLYRIHKDQTGSNEDLAESRRLTLERHDSLRNGPCCK